MSELRPANRRLRGPRAAMALTLPGLLACIVAFVLLPKEALLEPLTLLLAVCALFASVAWVNLDERLLIDASFVPSVLAMAFLGPAPAFAIVVVGELGSWCVRRYRRVVVPINILGLGTPALVGAAVLEASQPTGWAFYAVLGACGFLGLVLNDLVLTSLIGVLDDAPIASRLRSHFTLLPAISIDLSLSLATAALYGSAGLSAIAVVLITIITFNYMVTQMLRARSRAQRISELAASRQRLVVQALDAEDRERRKLSERLHDEAVQDLLIARQELVDMKSGDSRAVPRIQRAVEGALQELRTAVFDLHPAVLEHGGLAPALEAVAEQQARVGGFKPTVSVDPAVAGLRDRLLFAVGRELLTNVAKHASADSANVLVKRDAASIVLDVADDGCGFVEAKRKKVILSGHIGLASIAERVEAVGGTFDIDSSPGEGARVRVALPFGRLDSSQRASASTSKAAVGGPQGPIRAQ